MGVSTLDGSISRLAELLRDLLGLDRPQVATAVGLVCSLVGWIDDNRPWREGGLIGSALDVEARSGWLAQYGTTGDLVGILREAGIIDEVAPGRFELCSYWQHACERKIAARRVAARRSQGKAAAPSATETPEPKPETKAETEEAKAEDKPRLWDEAFVDLDRVAEPDRTEVGKMGALASARAIRGRSGKPLTFQQLRVGVLAAELSALGIDVASPSVLAAWIRDWWSITEVLEVAREIHARASLEFVTNPFRYLAGALSRRLAEGNRPGGVFDAEDGAQADAGLAVFAWHLERMGATREG